MWLLPTLNRTEKLKTFLKSALKTETSTPGRILIDQSDFKLHEKEYVEINNQFLPPHWALEITDDAVTMGDKSRWYIPKLLQQKPETQWAGLLNDDHFCNTQNWDQKLISRLDGKNFVSANDRTINAFRFPVTATAWSVPLIQCLGWPIYPPFLQHLFIDNIWLELGKATGCWRMVASSIVEHLHVLRGAEEDDTHRRVYNEERWKADEAGFNQFMRSPGFQEAIQRIKKLQDFLPGEQWNPKVKKSV